MSGKIQSIRGMRTIYGDEGEKFSLLRKKISNILESASYKIAYLPLLEKTDLFQRAVGEETDVVSKEMYTFLDRNEESITLRPEATAGIVRALIEEGLLQQLPQRIYTIGEMFRYERPQKGRYRQFYQVSVENFGSKNPIVEAELIALTWQIFQELGLENFVQLEINTIGLAEERSAYQKSLITFLEQNYDLLDEDSQKRLHKNPLRILDSKNAQVQKLLNNAPILDDYLGEESKNHYLKVCQYLEKLGIAYTRNSRLVRGLDYYNHTVFEWSSRNLGAQTAVCGGGRYDNLVEQLGGNSTPAAGFGIGLDRLLLLVQEVEALPTKNIDVYAFCSDESAFSELLLICQNLRQLGLKISLAPEAASIKKQISKADKSRANFALIIGTEELNKKIVLLKNLKNGEQKEFSAEALIQYFQQVNYE